MQSTQAAQLLSEMVRTARIFRYARHHATERHHLTGSGFGVLRQLSLNQMRARDLAQSLGVSAAVMSRTVDALETEGLVSRSPDPDDARAALLEITHAGRTVLAESDEHVIGEFSQTLAHWKPGDVEHALALLDELNTGLAHVLDVPDLPRIQIQH